MNAINQQAASAYTNQPHSTFEYYGQIIYINFLLRI